MGKIIKVGLRIFGAIAMFCLGAGMGYGSGVCIEVKRSGRTWTEVVRGEGGK